MDFGNHEKKLEKLSRAITEAILRSNNVRKALLDLQREDLIGSNSFIMLVMCMDGLADLVNSIHENRGRRSWASKKGKEDQYIDGRKLTQSEIDFYEYLAENFDEAEWLKKNRLIFD